MESYINLSQEVRNALETRRPVVALESTVIAHGLPYPRNLDTALAMESIIRDGGATPATIAVFNGKLQVGLTQEEIERLATSDGILKLGTRDLPEAVAFCKDGATTVSATAFIASRAGIPVFVTGGIGGIHRGATVTFDISSDLWELTKSAIMVVCSGAKAILDISATLEWLELHQVPILGYRTNEFPGFYSRHTGLEVEQIQTPEEAAECFSAKLRMGIGGGMLIGVPVPKEFELDVSSEILDVLNEAERHEVRGKEVTPWMLSRLDALTGGKSVDTNIALLKNNAGAGAEIAKALVSMRAKR